jgi:hydrogenase expression/formation protein HypC
MCIGIPMQILHIDGYTARAAAKGVERDISLFMLPEDEVAEGDFVIVHVGYATQKISEENARSSWELFDRILAETDG